MEEFLLLLMRTKPIPISYKTIWKNPCVVSSRMLLRILYMCWLSCLSSRSPQVYYFLVSASDAMWTDRNCLIFTLHIFTTLALNRLLSWLWFFLDNKLRQFLPPIRRSDNLMKIRATTLFRNGLTLMFPWYRAEVLVCFFFQILWKINFYHEHLKSKPIWWKVIFLSLIA